MSKGRDYSEVYAILLDTTDSLSPVQQEIVEKNLGEFAAKVPRYGKLSIFIVRPSSDRLIQPLAQMCNPGRASDTNEFTGNPRLMEKRWRDKFMIPADKSVRDALFLSDSAKQSPIMEEIQQVSVQAFFEIPQQTSKHFSIVSDMLHILAVLNQYRDQEFFEEFQQKPAFVKVRPQLNDVGVTVLYVRRPSDFKRQGKRHVEFWRSFFASSGAQIEEIMSVNG